MSLAALVAMYHLWWTRDRALYAGKGAEEQRAVVLERAGIPAKTLEMAEWVDVVWPLKAAYAASGAEVTLSYFKYLVLPRVPSGSNEYRIEEGEVLDAGIPTGVHKEVHPLFLTVAPTPRGLALSAAVLFSIAAGLCGFGLSLPEGVACALLVLCLASMLAKSYFHSYMPVGIFMFALGFVGLWMACARRHSGKPAADEPSTERGKWVRLLQWSARGVLLGSVLWAFLMAVVVVPDDWDAWAIWGPKAKVLLLGTGPLADVIHFGHPDYPLLWPSAWAFSAWCAGGWEEQWSKGWGTLFFMLTLWQMGRISFDFSGRRESKWIVPALFASMPAVPLIASWAYAEAALWLVLVCGFGRIMNFQKNGQVSDAAWAGVFAAAAALTKNEGALFFVMGLGSLILSHGKHKRKGVGAYSVIFAALYVPWLVWIRRGAELVPGASIGIQPSTWDLIWDRVFQGLSLIGRMWLDVRQWNIVAFAVLGLVLFLATCRSRTFFKYALIPLGLGIGSFAVIILRDGPLDWQIGTAWNRLTIQFFVLLLPALAAGFGLTRSGECACPKQRLEQE